jgi:hypothetical protein
MENQNISGYCLRSSSLFPLIAFLLFVSLLIFLLILPIDYTYDETCPTCQGKGTVTCESCHGSGKCWVCDGTGKIWYMPGDGWCAACQGTGICPTCGGKGWHTCGKCGGTGLLVHWMYTLAGSAVVPSIIGIFLFLGFFVLSGFFSAFYLSFNEWIYEVEDMGFWFNPSFMTWLFAKHRKRWAKWQTGLNLILAIYFGILLFGYFSLSHITQETFVTGTLLSIAVVSLFSLVFYKAYISRLEASQ